MGRMFVDLGMSRRVERAEGRVAASFAEILGREWRDFDGTTAIFAGADSPMTQTFGFGLFAPPTAERLDAIEAFFAGHSSPVLHEISPLAGVETTALLVARGYTPVELSTVLVQDVMNLPAPKAVAGLTVRRREEADRREWVETSVQGWGSEPEFAAVVRTMAETASKNPAMHHFLVERGGAQIATGSFGAHESVALLAGASTVPSGRGLGAQGLLLSARLHAAQQLGCTVAVMAAAPGSTSQRNAERGGFQVAYTRTKWKR